MSYSSLRLTHESQLLAYRDKMGWTAFKAYMDRVYNKIDDMKPGDRFRIDDLVAEENRDLFIKLLCLFASMHGTATYYFNENYTWFYRNGKKENFDWRRHEDFIRENISRMPLAEMAETLNVVEYDLYQYVHRERIFPISTKPKNLAYELVKMKFVHPEYFKPTRRFYQAVKMTQRQWWAAFRGEVRLTEEQYKRLSIHLGITLEEAFEARQLELITIEE